jgi:hypothetical protein
MFHLHDKLKYSLYPALAKEVTEILEYKSGEIYVRRIERPSMP